MVAVEGGFPDLGPVRVRGREVEEICVAGDITPRGIIGAFRARVRHFAFIIGIIVMDPVSPRCSPTIIWREVISWFGSIRGEILEDGGLFGPGVPEVDLGGGHVDVADEVVAGAGGPRDELFGAGAGEVGYGGVVVDGVDVGGLREGQGEGEKGEEGEERRREGWHGVCAERKVD